MCMFLHSNQSWTSSIAWVGELQWRTFLSSRPTWSESSLQIIVKRTRQFKLGTKCFRLPQPWWIRFLNTPDGGDSEDWKLIDLDHSVSILTGGLFNKWNDFTVKDLCPVYRQAYEVCSSNWIPGEDEECVVQQRLKLPSSLVKRKQVNFFELVVSQIRRINSDLAEDSNVCFLNFIHQIMECQKYMANMFLSDESHINGEEKHSFFLWLCRLLFVICFLCVVLELYFCFMIFWTR